MNSPVILLCYGGSFIKCIVVAVTDVILAVVVSAQAWQLMFDSVDTANDCIRIATGVLSTIRINPDRMLAGLSPDMLATDLAEYLVRKGALILV